VDVHLSGDLDRLPPSVGTAVYRIAQEAVTNAVRHARDATLVTVEIGGDAHWVHLTVRDDGEAVPTGVPTPGYGLLGMTERTSLLGGDVRAGPTSGGGWTVEATLPRGGPTKASHQAAQRSS
jgi:signal transduction histidine kinase